MFGALWALQADAGELPLERELTLAQALQLALAHDPEIRLVETQVHTAAGVLEISRGIFDPELTAGLVQEDSQQPVDLETSRDTESLRASLGWSQTLRSGQTLEPQLEIEQLGDSVGSVNTATLSFRFRQPLLRARQPDVITAAERSAGLELEAARLDLAHTTSTRLLAVTSQYWTVRARTLELEILRLTEESSRDLLAKTRRLVEAQLTPAAELVQLEADLVLQEANRVVGERGLFEARRELGRELGLNAEHLDHLGLPADRFPVIDPTLVPEGVDFYLREALARRADLRASRRQIAAEEARLLVADDGLSPRLDLVLTPSISGLTSGAGSDDFLSSPWSNVPGLSATFGLELLLPIHNREAEGRKLQAEAALTRSSLQAERDRKAIASRVPTALDAVRRNAQRLVRLNRAVELFEKAVANESKKLQAGTSTLIDVISQRDRLTATQRSRIAAQLELALAIAELRFETGTLISADSYEVVSVSSDHLTTLPF